VERGRGRLGMGLIIHMGRVWGEGDAAPLGRGVGLVWFGLVRWECWVRTVSRVFVSLSPLPRLIIPVVEGFFSIAATSCVWHSTRAPFPSTDPCSCGALLCWAGDWEQARCKTGMDGMIGHWWVQVGGRVPSQSQHHGMIDRRVGDREHHWRILGVCLARDFSHSNFWALFTLKKTASRRVSATRFNFVMQPRLTFFFKPV
jgi:hypothetical protein